MRVVARRTAVTGAVAFATAVAIFLCVGGLRLWPRIAGQHLPLSMVWPFARPLLAAGLELSFLVSVPPALGIASSLRSARAHGDSSWQGTLFAAVLLVLGVGGLSFGVSSWLDGRGSSPGELATELVASARESCVDSAPPAEVAVPLVGFAWVCEAGRAPFLKGRAPMGKQAVFQAASIALGDDLKRVSLKGFTLGFPMPPLEVKIRAKEATLSGLPPWGRSRRIPLALRVWLFTLSAGLASYGVGRIAARRAWLPSWVGAAIGAVASASLWWAVSWLERQEPRAGAYLILPVAGVAGALVALMLIALVERFRPNWASGRPSTPAVAAKTE